MTFNASRIWRCVALALIIASLTSPMPSPGQTVKTEGLGNPLSDSERIGDPADPSAVLPLWIRAKAAMPLNADGFVVFQRGRRLRNLDRSNFDPNSPFVVVVAESSNSAADGADAEIKTGEQFPANAIPMQENPIDIGPYHLSTDLLLVRVQGFPWTISLGFMWPRDGGSAIRMRRWALVKELHEIIGSNLEFGRGHVASPDNGSGGLIYKVSTSLLNFEVLVLEKDKINARTDIQPHQFKIYEGCAPEENSSCKPVQPRRIETAERSGGRVNFIVLPEIGGPASLRTIIRDAVSRLVDFTKPQDRAAIVPYYERATIWQPLTGDKEHYRAQASKLFEAEVGSRTGSINTYGAVTTALTELASANSGERHVMLMITEGHDCFNPYEIAKMAAAHNTSIWVLDLTGQNHRELKPLAEMSGGFYFRVDGYDSLLAHIEEFVDMWKRVYLISYTPVVYVADGQAPRREIRVVGAGEVFLVVSKGFRGPQVIANMHDLETYDVAVPLREKFREARTVEDLFPLIRQIGSDSDFAGFVAKAIGLSNSVDQFFSFLDRIDPVATGKRLKTIGHLITSNFDVFTAMQPSAKDWLRLRSRVGHAEDWKRTTEVFLPQLTSAEEFLQALSVRDIPETPGYAEAAFRALVAEAGLAQVQRFVSLKPTASQQDSFLSVLPNEDQKIQARRAFGVPLAQLAPDIIRVFQESKDAAQSLSLLEGLLRSAAGPTEFEETMNIYLSSGQPNAEAVASGAALACLKKLASIPSPQAMIPVALKSVRGCSERVAVVRELKGSIVQINELKEAAVDESCLLSIYFLAVSQARSAEELTAALALPNRRRFMQYEKLRDGLIQALLPGFKGQARPAEQYLVLAAEAQAIALKTAVLEGGLSALADPAAKQRLQSALDQIKRPQVKQRGTGK